MPEHNVSHNNVKTIGWFTAGSIVVANMIGTGVFTSLGFQLEAVKSSWSIILLWIIGGVLSFIGALVYAELGTHFRKSGGDYIFLSNTFHPLLGYLYAWTSLTVGFSAPIAISAMAMVYYLKPFTNVNYGTALGVAIIILVSLMHSFSIRQSGIFHIIFTLIKILFAVALIMLGLVTDPVLPNALDFSSPWSHELLHPGFAVSLIYVAYAYTGWNAAAYITEEIQSPEKNLPKALLGGTLFVALLYLMLHIVFLKHADIKELQGNVDVALISFGKFFNGTLLPWVSLLISLQLIATISGYVWIGPRITFAMARDFRLWKNLSVLNKRGIPVRALWFNTIIAIILLLTGSFEQVLVYASFVLQVMATLSIAASLRIQPLARNFRAPLRPFLQIVYIIFSIWILGYTLYEKPVESLIGIGLMAVGTVIYFFDRKKSDIQN